MQRLLMCVFVGLAVVSCAGLEDSEELVSARSESLTAKNASIYRDALVSPWENYSWAAVNLASSSPVAAGTRSIAATLGPWQGVYFHRGAFPSSDYSALTLSVNGGAKGAGAVVRVRAVLSTGAWTSGVNLGPACSGGSIPANRWATCRISMASLAPAGAAITGIALQEWSGVTLPTLYFDEIGLEAAAPAVSVTVAPQAPSVTAGQTVKFSASVKGSSNTAVTWSVQEGAPGGSVTASGLYTAPTAAGTFHVVATSRADSTKTARATVTVAAKPVTICIGSSLLSSLGKKNLLVGFSGEDSVASQAGWDVRYQYIAGPIASPSSGCSSASGAWWGCWQDWAQPPGQFVVDFVHTAGTHRAIPMLTYYVLLQASGYPEGVSEVSAAKDLAFMTKYLSDWRFLLTKIGSSKAFLHIEPDFWGYAQQVSSNPHSISAAVSSANSTDCAGFENSIAGLGRCMISMVRKYAPNAKVGLHASGWASAVDVLMNTTASLNVAGEAAKVGQFLAECGADADFVVADMSDRDAGYYQSVGRAAWWDASNATLPSFSQALAWAKSVAETLNKPLLWWQVPVGNMSQSNTTDHWKDNRVQYFFDHPRELASTHAFGIVFGAGAGGQTTPSTDGGYLAGRAASYYSAGGVPYCP